MERSKDFATSQNPSSRCSIIPRLHQDHDADYLFQRFLESMEKR